MSRNDTNDDLPRRQPTAIEREALEWVARRDRGLAPAQKAEFDRWLAADARHAAIFDEFDGTWAFLDRVREMPAAVSARADSAAPARSPRGSAPGQVGRPPRCRWIVRASLAAAALFVVAFLRWPLTNTAGGKNSAYAATLATQLGELRKVALPDGSIVQLNTDSAVDVQFSASARQLRLVRGEAYFIVAKNPLRPFTVRAGGVDVRAIGTVFNVRLRSEAVEVLVTEGKVTVGDQPGPRPEPVSAEPSIRSEAAPHADSAEAGRTPASSRALAAGEKITIPLAPHSGAVATPAAPVAVSSAEIEHALAWQEHRLEFVSAPLAEMIAEFNRYNRRKLVIADANLAAQRFGGVFRLDDAEGFVRALEVNFGVVAEQRVNETVLRLAAR